MSLESPLAAGTVISRNSLSSLDEVVTVHMAYIVKDPSV